MHNLCLWQPDQERIQQSNLQHFMAEVNRFHGLQLHSYAQLYQWSVEKTTRFWPLVWQHCGVKGELGNIVAENRQEMQRTRWFPDSRLNFAENLLRRQDDTPAIISRIEGSPSQTLSWRELADQVARLAQWLRGQGIGRGDVVAAYLPNIPQTVVAMLATTSLGAIWTSTSPDFGEASVVERFGQTRPRVLFAVDGYRYNGKAIDIQDKVAGVVSQLDSIEQTVLIPLLGNPLRLGHDWHQVLASQPGAQLAFEPMGFNDPLYILYSSGTTGKPKCIVHGIGGTLLQHLKEHQLHCDIKPGERVFYFTTCGWMMWNWLVSALASGATLVLYDGSPFYPDGNVLWDLARDEQVALFGTSAKYLDAFNKQGYAPIKTHELPQLRLICSTGSVLSPEGFDYVYQQIKKDVQLSSISGGTDICSCFVIGNPISPVYRGESQGRGLGLAVQVFNEAGQPVQGEKGELVCTKPFPAQPIGFWGDDSGDKYHAAYFERFDNIWCHGDWIELTPTGGILFYGRSDATLNPGGVRIGTSEIYRYVEQLEEVEESIVIGQQWQQDERVVLFVKLKPGLMLDEALRERIRQQVRLHCTARHVPARILQVDAIPRTKSGKIVELAVREVVHNRPVNNTHALADPEVLSQYRDRPELAC
ncbi:acetoacetate--CoA ligase [Aeromonas hydrophila]|uniref:acetoacetate--CoA ligase n=1 Tax=Aeromonas hydrophila TaxID=644 RepID=UPI0011174360|nr:acetoacetate--CoA ligase [Aeromonas hydrophila]TNH81771.1 acetoacetate--CoA ligase [Aeromonas hydrophila]TNI03471.1 acetoacetate--CoA ligase [Aeromonas hydrophila]TNI90435.1 acetoacetate--CoA ligase [Aeromonas hydrophila]